MDPLLAQRVLVTGATGFIGSHLVRRLVAEGADVHLLVRPGGDPWRIADVMAKCTSWTADLADGATLATVARGARPTIVFHLAAVTAGRKLGQELADLMHAIDCNVRGTVALLHALRGGDMPLTRFVATGGLEEYGGGPAPYDEGQREAPVSPYSASQTAGTHLCQMLNRRLGLPIVTLRPALVYGPAQSTEFFIPALIRRCLDGGDFEMTSGDQRRDLIFVDDLVEAFVRAATTSSVAGEVINVCSGAAVPIRDVAAAIVRASGSSTRLQSGVLPQRVTEITDLEGRNAKAARLLGWRPTTGLEEGLTRTIAWYRAHHGETIHVDAGR